MNQLAELNLTDCPLMVFSVDVMCHKAMSLQMNLIAESNCKSCMTNIIGHIYMIMTC